MNSRRIVIAGIECLIAEPTITSADTQTLLCMHGIGGDDASFTPQTQSLANEFRIVSWKMPGYGCSTPINPLSFEALANKVIELIDALTAAHDVGTVHLVGQSIGGMIAQEVFHRYPERFTSGQLRSLILIATTSAFGSRDESFKKAFLEARLKPLENGLSMQQIAEAAIPSIVGQKTDQRWINAAVKSMAAINPECYREVLKCLITFNRRSEWATINCPVCLIAGSEDTNAPAVTLQKMGVKLQQCHYHEVEGAGHLVNLECGDRVNTIIRSFLHQMEV